MNSTRGSVMPLAMFFAIVDICIEESVEEGSVTADSSSYLVIVWPKRQF